MKSHMLFSFLLATVSITYADNLDTEAKQEMVGRWGLGDFFDAVSTSLESVVAVASEALVITSSDLSVELAKKIIRETFPVQEPVDLVTVQTSTKLDALEILYLQNRLPKVQQVLQNDFDIDQPLRLAICCGGGGNRAMIGTIGLLLGAAKSKVLDTALYISGASASTWSIVPFSYLAATSYRGQSFEKVLTDMKQSLTLMLDDPSMINIQGIYAPPLISFDSTDDFSVDIAKRFAYDQPLTLVNLFGALVGDYSLKLLGCDRLSERWSTIAPEVEKGNIPLPLCSAIFEVDSVQEFLQYEWFEMSPFQAGSSRLGYVPIQYLGSYFQNGSLDLNRLCYEYPISFYLGVCGSTFSMTIQDIGTIQRTTDRQATIFKELLEQDCTTQPKRHALFENSFIYGFVQDWIHDIITSRNSLTYAQFPNYSQGFSTSSLRDNDIVGLFDSGIDFDLPLPTLVDRPERNLDIVILYDSHSGSEVALRDISSYCQKKGIAFPDMSGVTQLDLQSQVMTVINDPRLHNYDSTVTTYIYFPTNDLDISSSPYLAYNFKYTENDIEQLSNKMEQAFLSKASEIREIMKFVAQKRYT